MTTNKKPTKQTIIRRMNKSLEAIPTYDIDIPLDRIFEIVKSHGGLVVDEAGEAWSGFLCGASGSANMEIKSDYKNLYLHISWYKMDSGRYETIAYVS